MLQFLLARLSARSRAATSLAAISVLGALAAAVAIPAAADEAAIRKNIAERMADFPKIDEITKTPIPGLYELRVGNEVFYADEQADHVITGQVIDTRTRDNLTENRIAKLTAIDVAGLPLKDAMLIRQGSGTRKLVVFADPNCGYCKRFERDLVQAKDVSVYVFLYPILGADSKAKARDIWCSKDPGKTWRSWMIDGVTPPKNLGACDTAAIDRNAEFGRKHQLQGTPALVFENGTRIPGALTLEQLEKQLAAATAKS